MRLHVMSNSRKEMSDYVVEDSHLASLLDDWFNEQFPNEENENDESREHSTDDTATAKHNPESPDRGLGSTKD